MVLRELIEALDVSCERPLVVVLEPKQLPLLILALLVDALKQERAQGEGCEGRVFCRA